VLAGAGSVQQRKEHRHRVGFAVSKYSNTSATRVKLWVYKHPVNPLNTFLSSFSILFTCSIFRLFQLLHLNSHLSPLNRSTSSTPEEILNSINMVKYEGQCHCGAVAWTAEIPEERHVLCHCDACKIMGGGEFTLNQIIPASNFQLTKGDLKVYTYKGDSGNTVDCFMCANCGSSPYHHQHVLGADTIVIRTGLLKGTKSWPKPAAEIYDKDRAAWLPQTAEASFPVVPPS